MVILRITLYFHEGTWYSFEVDSQQYDAWEGCDWKGYGHKPAGSWRDPAGIIEEFLTTEVGKAMRMTQWGRPRWIQRVKVELEVTMP